MVKVALLAGLLFGVVVPLGAVYLRRTPQERARVAARRAARRR